MSTCRERFTACMEYESGPPRPNHELGAWPQTRRRWEQENAEAVSDFTWDWFEKEAGIGLDRREYIPIHFGFIPGFEHKVLEDTPLYEVTRHANGIVTRALKEGTVEGCRMSMDQYLRFPVEKPEDFPDIKRRLIAAIPERYPADLEHHVKQWKDRDFPLVLGRNGAANGFYWRAREFMGTEQLSYAWHDEPRLMHEMMEFFADFVIETSRPVLDKIQIDYFTLNEDMAMKNGPLLSPSTFRAFIFPHLKRMVEFFKSHGTRYFAVDTDGNPEALVPLLMDAGVDILWPLERASPGVDPSAFRRRFGKGLRLWGGVDKRVLVQGRAAIREHLRELIPLVEEGGFIPTVDHTVPPDVSWDNFRYYMECKQGLLAGDYRALAKVA
jgi:uroporphyrinogen decarboxylase